MKYWFLAISIAGLLVGILSHNEMIDGFGKAFAGVFFILAYIVHVFGGQEIDYTGKNSKH